MELFSPGERAHSLQRFPRKKAEAHRSGCGFLHDRSLKGIENFSIRCFKIISQDRHTLSQPTRLSNTSRDEWAEEWGNRKYEFFIRLQ